MHQQYGRENKLDNVLRGVCMYVYICVCVCVCLMTRLHQDTCRPETCIPNEQLVSGYIYVDLYILLVAGYKLLSGMLVDCITAT